MIGLNATKEKIKKSVRIKKIKKSVRIKKIKKSVRVKKIKKSVRIKKIKKSVRIKKIKKSVRIISNMNVYFYNRKAMHYNNEANLFYITIFLKIIWSISGIHSDL